MTVARSIFISYRRSDSIDITGRIHDRLVAQFGLDSIFKDVDAIPFGVDFRKHLEREVSHCPILLAIIGPTWLDVTDAEQNRRLDNPSDWVRIEIETALQRDSVVIPILVGGADLPKDTMLPEGLKGLSYRQSALVRHDPDFHPDMDRLIQRLEDIFDGLSLHNGAQATMAQPKTYPNLVGDLAAALTHASQQQADTAARQLTRRRYLRFAGLCLLGGGGALATSRLWPIWQQQLPKGLSAHWPNFSSWKGRLQETFAKAEKAAQEFTAEPALSSVQATPYTYQSVTVNEFGLPLHQVQFSTDAVDQISLEAPDGPVIIRLVMLEGGSFVMGSPTSELGRSAHDLPQTIAEVEPFDLSIYPITQHQWRAVAVLPAVNRELPPNPAYFVGEHRPVEQVSWKDAVEFCERLSRHRGELYRLPREAEWEYACRAKTITPFHFGKTLTADLANYDSTQAYKSEVPAAGRGATSIVGCFEKANDFGLYDMHGNVLEWCEDRWEPNQASLQRQSSQAENATDLRVLRGGGWQSPPQACRSAYRTYRGLETRHNQIGFRIVRVRTEGA